MLKALNDQVALVNFLATDKQVDQHGYPKI